MEVIESSMFWLGISEVAEDVLDARHPTDPRAG